MYPKKLALIKNRNIRMISILNKSTFKQQLY